MSHKIWCLLLVLVVVRANLATKCKKYVAWRKAVVEYYQFNDENLRFMKKSPNGAIEMHISIQTSTDGHIVLSPKPISGNPIEDTDPVYAIVIGHDYNRKIELRRNQMPKTGNILSTVDVPETLSATELRSFYIKISEDGVIEVGKEGSPPLIRYLDENPLDINYFGFSSWKEIKAIFLYDCPWPGSYSDHGSNCEHKSALKHNKSNDEHTGKPENEFTVKINVPDSKKTVQARLEFNVYGDKSGDLPESRYIFGPQHGALSRPPYPYSAFSNSTETATTSNSTATTSSNTATTSSNTATTSSNNNEQENIV